VDGRWHQAAEQRRRVGVAAQQVRAVLAAHLALSHTSSATSGCTTAPCGRRRRAAAAASAAATRLISTMRLLLPSIHTRC